MKKVYKRLCLLCLCACLVVPAAFMLSACGAKSEKKLLSVVCTGFPQYDWARVVIGERTDVFELKYLMESGVDLHSYVPSMKDASAVLKSDLVIPLGAGSDPWVTALAQQNGKTLNRLSLDSVVTLLQPLDDHHDWDEHLWLSIKNAALCVDAICKKIIELDPENAEYYRANADNYIAALNELDTAYAAAAEAPNSRDTVIIADRFPFLYMFTDYGINHYSAFPSCSAVSDVPASKITYLIEKTNEFNIKVILKIEDSSAKCAEMIRDSSSAKNQTILTMHSIQSVSRKEIDGGFNYLDIMRDNLTVFSAALQP